jgi:UDP:flavonoid glycosyltransferase YjiC (YdhE family)
LAARLVAWQGIFSLAKPEVVIGDHAPTALLAAELSGISHLAIGNAFAIPPTETPWPSIRPWETIAISALVLAEVHLDQVTAAAQKLLGHTRAVRVRELFGRHDVLETFSELDHYGERLGGRYIGPIVCAPKVQATRWQDKSSAKILAYIRPEVPHFKHIMAALARVDAEVLCVVPGLAPVVAREAVTNRLRISLGPLELPSLLASADLAVSYGNCGFSTQSLLAGVPLLMSPIHVEQGLFARRVERMQAGKLLTGHANVQHVQENLDDLLDAPGYRQAARKFRDRYRYFSPEQAIENILKLVEELITRTNKMPTPALQE